MTKNKLCKILKINFLFILYKYTKNNKMGNSNCKEYGGIHVNLNNG